MTDLIIIGILAVVLFFGVHTTVKHFRGEGSCCGGSTCKAHRKKLNAVVGRRVFSVEGMSCQHCVNRVMEAVNAIDGASAVVNLKKGTAIVSLERPIDDAVIRSAIEKAGYRVTGISA